MMIEVTTECNMRCRYCSVSSQYWTPKTIDKNLAYKLIDDIKNLNPSIVHIHGHGETTIIDWWCEYAQKLLDSNINISLCSNLTKKFNNAEIAMMTRMSNLTVSIDTINEETSRTIRRGGNIKNIIFNLITIMTHARSIGSKTEFSLSVVVSNENIDELINLVNFASIIGISNITFCNLEIDESIDNNVAHISDSHQADCMNAIKILNSVNAMCLHYGIKCDFKSGLIDSLNRKTENVA